VLQTLSIRTRSRNESRDVTAEVEHVVRASGVASGICYLYVPHTTAGVAINEHADPDVMTDVEGALRRLVPHSAGYQHAEGNADAHIKAVMVGASQSLPIENGRLALGTWQGIFFCEFDGPRERKLRVKIIAG
jgi:secondary thiamine-phosphate synthase enzyme